MNVPPPPPPHVQVVRGVPDDVELAALVAGLVAAAAEAPDHDAPARTSAWSDRGRRLRGEALPAPGQDAWRWSLRG
ncbi:acyl-CoA carboxylase epsilon subunit [Cellulomonas soli]|uniref:acyl-CoA carboxylase epsilon subunit n=1 Tax=Cellulomonas soli TaxID=931535 RepID=UPI003F879D19